MCLGAKLRISGAAQLVLVSRGTVGPIAPSRACRRQQTIEKDTAVIPAAVPVGRLAEGRRFGSSLPEGQSPDFSETTEPPITIYSYFPYSPH
jgi:hypothetical protein